MVHVAIVGEKYIRAILEGTKTIESRFSRSRHVPFGRVKEGERVYFKATGGPYGCTAVVEHVEYLEDLDPKEMRSVRRTFGARIGAEPRYWASKTRSRYGTLIWLRNIEATEMGPVYAGMRGITVRSGWLTLPEEMDVYPRQMMAIVA